jgi:DNA gyrase subunit A
VLLTTGLARCIRFPVSEVRVFMSRDSTGVRGIKLAEGDSVISMAILHGVDASPAERGAYLKHANAMRAAASGEATDADDTSAPDDAEEADAEEATLSVERIAELGAAEEHILTVSSEGFGKRTSAYDYRRTGRGGQGLMAHDVSKRGGRLVASFPVDETDEILLVTDGGQLIRVPVTGIRIAARNTQGVIIFRKSEGEHVVGVERLAEAGGGEDGPDDAPLDGDVGGGDDSGAGSDAP